MLKFKSPVLYVKQAKAGLWWLIRGWLFRGTPKKLPGQLSCEKQVY